MPTTHILLLILSRRCHSGRGSHPSQLHNHSFKAQVLNNVGIRPVLLVLMMS